MPPTAGTCAPPRGPPTAMSALPGPAGSGHAASLNDYPTTTPTNCRCASPLAPCCVPPTFVPQRSTKAGVGSRSCGSCAARPATKSSLAIGMTGPVSELLYAGRLREGSRLASEQMALLESIGDPTLTIGLSFLALVQWCFVGEFGEILRLSQIVVDLADGEPAKGAGFGIGSPLAAALAFRGVARWWLGRPGWREDLDDAIAMARNSDPATFAAIAPGPTVWRS